MKKVLILLLVCSVFLFGAKEKRGQKYYLKRCAPCHGSGKMWGNVATQKEWKDFFTKKSDELIGFHKGVKEALDYFNSKDFKKEKSRMWRFLQEFASDSDTIPSCNN